MRSRSHIIHWLDCDGEKSFNDTHNESITINCVDALFVRHCTLLVRYHAIAMHVHSFVSSYLVSILFSSLEECSLCHDNDRVDRHFGMTKSFALMHGNRIVVTQLYDI